MEDILIASLQESVDNGSANKNSGYKPVVWQKAAGDVKAITTSEYQPLVSPEKVKSKYNNLKRDYRNWKEIINLSGWSRD